MTYQRNMPGPIDPTPSTFWKALSHKRPYKKLINTVHRSDLLRRKELRCKSINKILNYTRYKVNRYMLLTLAWHPRIARGISYVNSITFRKYNLEVNILYLKSPPTVITPSAYNLTENTMTYHRNHPSSNPTFSLPPQYKIKRESLNTINKIN